MIRRRYGSRRVRGASTQSRGKQPTDIPLRTAPRPPGKPDSLPGNARHPGSSRRPTSPRRLAPAARVWAIIAGAVAGAWGNFEVFGAQLSNLAEIMQAALKTKQETTARRVEDQNQEWQPRQ